MNICCLKSATNYSILQFVFADFATDPALSMCVNPTEVFAAGVSTALTTTAPTTAAAAGNSDLATSTGNDVCCKDVVFNSGGGQGQQGRRRSSGARSLVSLPPGMVDSDADHEEEDMLMDGINWDKLL